MDISSARGSGVSTILLDLGGVLTPDPWEAVVLSPVKGLADLIGLDRGACAAAGSALWPRFSTDARATAAAWWSAFGAEIGHDLPGPLVEGLTTRLVVPTRAGLRLLAAVQATGKRLGIITDNTAFFFPIQEAALRTASWADPGLVFASHLAGAGKKTGLFERAAAVVDPYSTLVIDDRECHIARAASLGFATLLFSGEGSFTFSEPPAH